MNTSSASIELQSHLHRIGAPGAVHACACHARPHSRPARHESRRVGRVHPSPTAISVIIVTEAACQEFGWPWLSVEQAIVLLGGERLYALLSNPASAAVAVRQPVATLHGNSIAPAANLRQLETFKEEPK